MSARWHRFRSGVRELVAHLPNGERERVQWEQWCKELADKVLQHRKSVREKVESLCPAETMTQFQKETLKLQQQTLEDNKAARLEHEQSVKKAAWAEAKVRLDTFRDQYNMLVSELNHDQTEWDDRDDVTIVKNMQDLQVWKKTFEKIVTNFRLMGKRIQLQQN